MSEAVQAGPGAAGGDWRHLRGLPVLTYRVGGAMLGWLEAGTRGPHSIAANSKVGTGEGTGEHFRHR